MTALLLLKLPRVLDMNTQNALETSLTDSHKFLLLSTSGFLLFMTQVSSLKGPLC